MQLLVDHGADVLKVDSDNKYALHIAAEWGQLDAVKFLVEHGVPTSVKDVNGVCLFLIILL